MGRAGLMLSWSLDDEGVTFYPMTYTGVGGFHLWTAFKHLYWLSRKPERLTWVRIAWDGSAKVHISPYDYERISRPVAYHLLCAGVGDALVSSLVAFAGGDASGAIVRLLGQRGEERSATTRLVRPETDRLAKFAAILTAALLVTGLGASIAAGVLSPEREGIRITNVYWTPPSPGPATESHCTRPSREPIHLASDRSTCGWPSSRLSMTRSRALCRWSRSAATTTESDSCRSTTELR